MRMVEKNERTKELIKKRDEKRTQMIKSALEERHAIIVERTQYRQLSQKKMRDRNLSQPR